MAEHILPISLAALVVAAGCAAGTNSAISGATGSGAAGATSSSAAGTGGAGGTGGAPAVASSASASSAAASSSSASAAASSSSASTSSSSSTSSAGGGLPCVVAAQPGLAAWYRFDEATGPVCDSSGNGNHGTAMGAGYTRGVAGKIGSGITFDGTDGYVVIPAATSLDMTTAGTIEFWLSLSATPTGVGSPASRGTGQNDANVLVDTSCGNVQVIFTQADTTSVTANCTIIPDQTWSSHIAFVNDGTTISLYINGEIDAAGAGGDMGPLSSDLYLGRREQGLFPLSGSLDELKWWTVARTQAEICVDAGGVWGGSTCSLP